MKKTNKSVTFAVILTGLVFASCLKDNVHTGNENGGGTEQPTPPPVPVEKWVDLGLPSGLLWATYNVGATKPEEYGGYYAWGATSSSGAFIWSTCPYCNANQGRHFTKYCNMSLYGDNGYTDNLIVLQPCDDVATVQWGDGARIPTKEEWLELIDNCTCESFVQNDIPGFLITAPNGKSIFLPAAGYYPGYDRYKVRVSGFYWSSSLYTDKPFQAWRFTISNPLMAGADHVYPLERAMGLSVRPVRSAH